MEFEREDGYLLRTVGVRRDTDDRLVKSRNVKWMENQNVKGYRWEESPDNHMTLDGVKVS